MPPSDALAIQNLGDCVAVDAEEGRQFCDFCSRPVLTH
jgi:hypothetical protein